MSAPYSASSSSDVHSTCERYNLSAAAFASLQTAVSQAKAKAYCPYSKFRVGAALLSPDGSVTLGANVENASYPVTVCAERVALGTAVVDGKKGFTALAVATDVSPPASPCGMCRQL